MLKHQGWKTTTTNKQTNKNGQKNVDRKTYFTKDTEKHMILKKLKRYLLLEMLIC